MATARTRENSDVRFPQIGVEYHRGVVLVSASPRRAVGRCIGSEVHRGHAGCGAAWLARLTGGQEVPGSNPGSPTERAGQRPCLSWCGAHRRYSGPHGTRVSGCHIGQVDASPKPARCAPFRHIRYPQRPPELPRVNPCTRVAFPSAAPYPKRPTSRRGPQRTHRPPDLCVATTRRTEHGAPPQ